MISLGALRLSICAVLALTLVGSAAVVTSEAAFPGNNGPIAFREDQFETGGFGEPLFLAQPDGTLVTELSDRPGFFMDWRADGGRLAFDFFKRNGDEQIATIRPDGSGLRVITSGRGIHEAPTWSPSGRHIVFDYSKDNPNDADFETRLWRMRANGSHARLLPMRSRGFDVEPKYSPNGRRIAFGRLRFTKDGQFQQAVFVVGTKGRHRVKQLTRWRLAAEHPTWSPDSRWIVFNTPEGTVKAVLPNGKKRRTIMPASRGFGGHKPWVSPDGESILFMCENWGTRRNPPADYNQDICKMDVDGSNIVRVIDTPNTQENWPSWGPAQE